MDLNAFFKSEFDEHAAVVNATRSTLETSFIQLVDAAKISILKGGKILFFGNGGSAADCQHLATELTIRYKTNRAPIAALALTTDTSAITAGGNDLGFDEIFSRQLEALARPQDLAIGISTSGESENVIMGLRKAREIGCTAAGFGGKGGGPMASFANPYLIIPSKTTSRIQEMHITLGQMLCGALELELGLVKE